VGLLALCCCPVLPISDRLQPRGWIHYLSLEFRGGVNSAWGGGAALRGTIDLLGGSVDDVAGEFDVVILWDELVQ
jgi:hypothetical protein